jgi:DNA-binding transcriptional MerR regulator
MGFEDDGIAYYVKDGKLCFTEEGLRYYSEKERNRLVELNVQLGLKFDEICDHLAGRLGYGSKETLSSEMKARILEEAEELTAQWDAAVERADDPGQLQNAVAPQSDLQTLLSANHALCNDILAILDSARDRRIRPAGTNGSFA